MAPVPLRTLECSDLVLVPQNEAAFIQEVKNVANPRQMQSSVIDIEKCITSIRHKLSVVMYQGAIICRVNPNDFSEFERLANLKQRPTQPSNAIYKGCSYAMEDLEHYRLMVTFFIETFAATNFSLFDVCGYLLNNLYDLGLTAERTSFHKACELLKAKKSGAVDPVLTFLQTYDLSHATPAPWLKPLKGIRNRTTHRPITDICDVVISRRTGFYGEFNEQSTVFFLNKDLFPPAAPSVKLADFAEQVFNGIQEFVENLYQHLQQAVMAVGILPP